MASFSIHLAIGKKYMENNNQFIKNSNDFYKGIIAPDLVENKVTSHYTGFCSNSSLAQHLEEKVHLEKFLENESIDTDYQKGVFLHLITDYLFYNGFFDKKYIDTTPYDDFCDTLYYSYNFVNDYIDEKYQLEYSEFLADINKNIEANNKRRHLTYESGTNILAFDKLDKFINEVSGIDLMKYKEEIIQNHKNVFPVLSTNN